MSNPLAMTRKSVSPFLRWAGGKRKLISRLAPYLPDLREADTYHEPFFGAGALFFALRPTAAVISDANEHLVQCYQQIAHNADRVSRHLEKHRAATSEDHYYRVRTQYNSTECFSAAQAARFIYLNNTCFNGIFRVNREGQFNVPYGWKDSPKIPERTELRAVAKVLAHATIRVADFAAVLDVATEDDFVYLDPPYPPLNGTAYFTHYTRDRFDIRDQHRVALVFRELDSKGCKLMMTNADTPEIRTLYDGFHIHELNVRRYITCKNKKHSVVELVITNYAASG